MTLTKYEKSLIACLLAVALMATFFLLTKMKIKKESMLVEAQRMERLAAIKNKIDVLELQAKAFSIYDVDSGEFLYGKNDEMPLPLASLTKTMTIAVALQDLEGDSIIEIPKDAIAQDGDSTLVNGEKWGLSELAKLTLISSSNDGAYAIAKKVPDIVLKMNQKAKKIGMEKTSFFNSTGLDISLDKAGAYASAKDANLMAAYAVAAHPEIFGATILPNINVKSKSAFNHKVENTDTILNKIPNILFSKTGFTSLAGGNLTVIFKNTEGHRIAVTVLGSTQNGRFADIEKLVNVL